MYATNLHPTTKQPPFPTVTFSVPDAVMRLHLKSLDDSSIDAALENKSIKSVEISTYAGTTLTASITKSFDAFIFWTESHFDTSILLTEFILESNTLVPRI